MQNNHFAESFTILIRERGYSIWKPLTKSLNDNFILPTFASFFITELAYKIIVDDYGSRIKNSIWEKSIVSGCKHEIYCRKLLWSYWSKWGWKINFSKSNFKRYWYVPGAYKPWTRRKAVGIESGSLCVWWVYSPQLLYLYFLYFLFLHKDMLDNKKHLSEYCHHGIRHLQ